MSGGVSKGFLQLIRLGIGHPAGNLSESVDLAALKALAAKQGLSAVVLDGMEVLRNNDNHNVNLNFNLQEKILLAEWIGEVHQFYEQRYEQYLHAISDLAGFYNAHGFKMMVLKGYACSLDWPKPNHRPCGDIDIWQFGQQKEADELLANTNFTNTPDDVLIQKTSKLSNGSKKVIDNSHHHHTVFDWQGFMVENHYDFIEVHHHSSSPALEMILKEQGGDDSYSVDVYGEKVYLPSPNLHALFLLRHAMEHFASTDINLRQLFDWAFFVKAHGKEVDWDWLEGVLDEFGMTRLYDIFNAICVEDLGFEVNIFPAVQFDPILKERVLNDILNPEFSEEEPKSLIRRVLFKYRRWKANGWKQKLCYKGSRWNAFWSATWNHILKPSSI